MQDGESALARVGGELRRSDPALRSHPQRIADLLSLALATPGVLPDGGLGAADPSEGYAAQLAALRAEYAFWMRGAQGLGLGAAREHVCVCPTASCSTATDALDTPRDESYAEDAAPAAARRPKAELYRELRSAAESGWDFSSCWQRDPKDLASIEITAIIPVDLNSLLYGLERAISDGCARQWDAPCAREFHERAEHRHRAIDRYLWDPARHRYSDYQWRRRLRLDRPSAAMLYPLFVGIADDSQAREVAATVKALLLARGGLLATPVRTGQQWDSPNGWAPLQWIAVRGLSEAHEDELAKDIAQRWLATVSRVYHATGKLLEKYDVVESLPGGGGEYPTQDGFGWTNGVTRALMARYPDVGQPMQVSE
ncbi:MAG: trehalase family glycosidase [Steroidobacteraceae bacterium]